MIYDVTHVTRYTYGATVELTNGIVRLIPVSRDGQTLERFDLATTPPCLPPRGRRRPVRQQRLEPQDREAAPRAFGDCGVPRAGRSADRGPEESPSWEAVAAEALAIDSLEAGCPACALYPSRLIPLFDEATAYARRKLRRRSTHS